MEPTCQPAGHSFPEAEPAVRPVPSPPRPPAYAILMLLGATLLWGLSFPLSKNWLVAAERAAFPGGEVLAGLTLIALRMLLAVAVLAVFQPRLFWGPSRRELIIGLVIGLVNFVGIALQVWGLARTSPALSVFITSLASAWVPLLAFLCFRIIVAPLTLTGLAVGMSGAAVLGIRGDSPWLLGFGEGLTLAGSVIFAVVVLLLDRLGRKVRPGHLTAGFLVGHGVPALLLIGGWAVVHPQGASWLSVTGSLLQDPLVLTNVVLLALGPTVLSFHWMATYQPLVPASRAALIYLLEPVFGTAFSIAWGHDRLTIPLLIGGGLILGGNMLAELPAWLRQRRRERAA